MLIYSSNYTNLAKRNEQGKIIELPELHVGAIQQLLDYNKILGVTPEEIQELTKGIPLLISITLQHLKTRNYDFSEMSSKSIVHLISDNELKALQEIIICSLTSANNQVDMVYLADVFEKGALECDKLVNKFFVKQGSKQEYFVPKLIIQIFFGENYAQMKKYIRDDILKYKKIKEDRIFYQILIGENNLDFSFIKKLLKEKDYAVILNIFNLFERNAESIVGNHNKRDTIDLLYYFSEALIGAGEYSLAVDLSNNYKFKDFYAIRGPKSVSKNQLLLQYFNLLHLQHKYDEAIEGYKTLQIDGIIEAYWGEAHCLRHKGKINEAIEAYKLAIKKYLSLSQKQKWQQRSYYIKCLNESNSIEFYRENEGFDYQWNVIDSEIEKLDSEKKIVALLSTSKYRALYHSNILQQREEALNLLRETLEVYEAKKERLRFNLYFEKGEVLRKMGNYQKAVDFFEKSLQSANYNGDKNIIIYSILGILISELLSGKFFYFSNLSLQQEAISYCLSLCLDSEGEVNFNLAYEHSKIIQNIIANNLGLEVCHTINLPLF